METLITNKLPLSRNSYILWDGDVLDLLLSIEKRQRFNLVVTSPPYNIGKEYEKKVEFKKYIEWQESIIELIIPMVHDEGSICWQVGNYVQNGEIWPLDFEIAPIFKHHGLKLRNRLVWHYGHGLHSRKRFSGRYEVVLWFTKTDNYKFNLDPVRVPSKYPSKKFYKGPRAGEYSSNPLGKNPEDVWPVEDGIWDIPNVKSNHIEKAGHPAQFPVGLIEKLLLALTDSGDRLFDPFAGVSTTGVAAALHGRKYLGSEIIPEYNEIGKNRIDAALSGKPVHRPYDKPIYDPRESKLSIPPEEFIR
ncbi:DNA-methyltransferase [Candidatus Neomarinimicrobiota bacterium]